MSTGTALRSSSSPRQCSVPLLSYERPSKANRRRVMLSKSPPTGREDCQAKHRVPTDRRVARDVHLDLDTSLLQGCTETSCP